MGMLKITDCTGHHYTSIDNAFIDSYMAEANGEYVKVYLLLLRRIAAIAEKCGYYTSSTFNRNFHKTVGMTPEEWRKKPENFERKLLEFNVHSEEGW